MKKLLMIMAAFFFVFIDSTVNAAQCGNYVNIPAALPKLISNLVNLIKIITPIILIIMGMLDFAKSAAASDEKAMNESKTKFVKRLIAAVVVFLTITIVQFVFTIINTDDTNSMVSCINCFINGNCEGTEKYNPDAECKDIKTKSRCSGFDVNGDVCAWYEGKCIRAKDKPDTSGCRDYKTEDDCPEVHVNVRCKWDSEESRCSYNGKALSCNDMGGVRAACEGKNDNFGNVCAWKNGKCVIDNRENCEDYDSEDTCPPYTSEGTKCSWQNDKCQNVTISICSKYQTESACPTRDGDTLCDWQNSTCVQIGKAQNCSKWYSEEDCEMFEDDYGNTCVWEYGKGCKNA